MDSTRISDGASLFRFTDACRRQVWERIFNQQTEQVAVLSASPRMESPEGRRVRDAARALLNLLEEIEPRINAMCIMSANHGVPYTGPSWVEECIALRKALRETEWSA